jgi:MMP 1-O-methyltransferase
LTVVEIGSWKGRSTIVLALGLRARGGGMVHAIDPHRDSRLHGSTGVPDTYESFLANVRRAGVEAHVRPIRSLSHEARKGFAAGSVDMLFVDGSHLYEDVLRDIDDWTPALADVATVGFHDVHAEPGVKRALDKRVLPAGSPFHNAHVVESTLLADFRRPS